MSKLSRADSVPRYVVTARLLGEDKSAKKRGKVKSHYVRDLPQYTVLICKP